MPPVAADALRYATTAIRTNVRPIRPRSAAAPAPATYVTMHLTIDAANAGRLRQLAFTVAGDSLASVRVQPVLQTSRMHVWLCLKTEALDAVMDAIMRRLPRAQFGHFTAQPQPQSQRQPQPLTEKSIT